MKLSQNSFRTDLVFAAILLTAIVSVALYLGSASSSGSSCRGRRRSGRGPTVDLPAPPARRERRREIVGAADRSREVGQAVVEAVVARAEHPPQHPVEPVAVRPERQEVDAVLTGRAVGHAPAVDRNLFAVLVIDLRPGGPRPVRPDAASSRPERRRPPRPPGRLLATGQRRLLFRAVAHSAGGAGRSTVARARIGGDHGTTRRSTTPTPR